MVRSHPLDPADLTPCPVRASHMHRPGVPCSVCKATSLVKNHVEGAGPPTDRLADSGQTHPVAPERSRDDCARVAPDTPAPSTPSKPKPGQASEDALCASLDAAGLVPYETQYEFAKPIGRKYRADVAYPEARLLVEVDGRVHGIEEKRQRDCARDSIAAILGYRMVRATPKQVRDGLAVEWVRAALGRHA